MERAEVDVLRTTLGTVPGTVLGVTPVGICRWTSSAILWLIPVAIGSRIQRRTCGQVTTAIRSPIPRLIRSATRRMSCDANRRGTCRRTCERVLVANSRASGAVSLGEPCRHLQAEPAKMVAWMWLFASASWQRIPGPFHGAAVPGFAARDGSGAPAVRRRQRDRLGARKRVAVTGRVKEPPLSLMSRRIARKSGRRTAGARMAWSDIVLRRPM
jgi:hypothetical protein